MPASRGSDGLRTREAGAWTKEKLYYLDRYARAFMTAMGPKRKARKWSELVYIDPLCGPGRCTIRDSGEEIAGSPLKALAIQPAFDTFHFSDSSKRNIELLAERLPSDRSSIHLRVGDCNHLVPEVIASLSSKALGLAFLDPEGFEVHFETIRVLAQRRVDVIYLFPSGIGLKRNARNSLRTEGGKIDDLWGGREWRSLPTASVATDSQAIARTWVEAFRAKAATVGLRCSDEAPPLITNDRNCPMYHLLFLSQSDVGLRIWRNIKRTDARGQRSLRFT